MPKHSLIAGGTGMLRDVSIHLLKKYDIVSVIGRSSEGFEKLEKEAGKLSTKLNRLQLDYADYLELTNSLLGAIKDFGEISLCVSWIHSSAPVASLIIAKILNNVQPFDFYEIIGSSNADPIDKDNREEAFNMFENINYHKIILGHVLEGTISRWLTNEEICRGVIDSIEKETKISIIGRIGPREQMP